MKKTLTIFTPTYNRAYCLGQCYDSLVRQDNQDFLWLIIDDGSSDNTKEVVNHWIEENKIAIHYHYQENTGMHGGHNKAYDLIETELNVCIDSDDFMPDDAVDKVLTFWQKAEKGNNIAGVIGLDSYKNGEIIGKKFPNHLVSETLENIYNIHHIYGDKKIVYRTEIVNKYPRYPIFEGERFVPLGTLYLLIDKDYELLCLNEVLCIVEYMEDGSSRNIIKQYRRHPKGFRYARMLTMKKSNFFKVRLKSTVHYISHSIFLKDWNMLFRSPKPILTFLCFPIGVFLYFYVVFKTRDMKN
ncbi:glycosyltransferase family 2 protein [Aquimarina addita]|uniref:Glycosyltransferase family 2 protein n=1 Tax=Aquimarina addita TaxID=870485 RepID=A0ABP7XHH8_9FLAO